MTSRERIIVTPNIQEHKYKQTHVPVDIIYKFPGKLQTMQEIHLYSQLTLLADWLVHFPLQAPDPLTVLLTPGSILSALSLFKTKLPTHLCLLLNLSFRTSTDDAPQTVKDSVHVQLQPKWLRVGSVKIN